MPETRTLSENLTVEILYSLYELFIPIVIAVSICVFTNITRKIDDMTVYIMTPIVVFLLTSALSASGLNAVMVCSAF
jgi:hypothetical protein